MVTQDVTVRSGQRDLLGFVATPDGTSVHPGVVVIHEAFGLNDNIREITRRFGREGYVALAVDLFTGKNKALCMMRFMGATLAGREPSGVSDLRNALDYLTRQPRVDAARVGAIGFCLGGGYAIAWAKGDERLKAIAPFYGTNPRPLEAIRRICPVVGSYPGSDFTARSGRRLENQLSKLGVPHDIRIYPGAKHSFFNDRGRTFDAAAASDAWQRTLAFFQIHLRAGNRSP